MLCWFTTCMQNFEKPSGYCAVKGLNSNRVKKYSQKSENRIVSGWGFIEGWENPLSFWRLLIAREPLSDDCDIVEDAPLLGAHDVTKLHLGLKSAGRRTFGEFQSSLGGGAYNPVFYAPLLPIYRGIQSESCKSLEKVWNYGVYMHLFKCYNFSIMLNART